MWYAAVFIAISFTHSGVIMDDISPHVDKAACVKSVQSMVDTMNEIKREKGLEVTIIKKGCRTRQEWLEYFGRDYWKASVSTIKI